MHSPFVHFWVWLKPRGLDSIFSILMPKKIKHYVRFVEEGVVERLEQEQSVETRGRTCFTISSKPSILKQGIVDILDRTS
jgi:hypothetical protein